jgi:primary-amine oxidase
MFRSYELVPGSEGGPNPPFTTGDLWVFRYQSSGEVGASVGCNDNVLGTSYANGESVDGQDVVLWYCLRHHHRPRQFGEEQKVLPYEFVGFHFEPRDFLDGTPTNLYATQPPSP